MKKQIYISADYAEDGDKEVVDTLVRWGTDDKHSVNFIDTSKPTYGSVSNDNDCRACDLKQEFNRQINASSVVIFVVGDKTAIRTAGSSCNRSSNQQWECYCTPYKQNVNGSKLCKVISTCPATGKDVGSINSYSYLRHEFEQAIRKDKKILILYNSTRYEEKWLPRYMANYKEFAHPFWKKTLGNKAIGDYSLIKEAIDL